MKKWIAILLAVLMLLSMTACGGNTNDETQGNNTPDASENHSGDPRVGGILKEAYSTLSPTWDPYGQASWSTYIWAQNIFENCLVRGADNVIYPMVCEYEYAEDGLSLKLWIREGVKFSDGTPVTLEDVVASLQRAAQFTADVQTDLWDNVENYAIENDVLTFQFKEYNTSLMEVFCSPRPSWGGIMPKSICEKYGAELIADPADCIGTGPYVLDGSRSVVGDMVYMVRNDNYCICEASADDNGYASPKRQYLDGIKIVKNGDKNSLTMSLISGELDVITTNSDTYEELLQGEGLEQAYFSHMGAVYGFFNCSESRIVSDANLRKAIAAAMDFEAFGYANKLTDPDLCSPVNCGDAYQTDMFKNADWYNGRKADLVLAKEYLEKSNYQGQSIKVLSNSDGALSVMAQQLAEVGINMEYQTLDNATLISYAADPSQDWDMIFRGNPTATTNPGDLHSTYYKTWNNSRANELIEQMKHVPTGSEESIACWEELANLMVEEVPFIIFGGNGEYYSYHPDLNLNRTGIWQYFHNAYWNNPSEHNSWE